MLYPLHGQGDQDREDQCRTTREEGSIASYGEPHPPCCDQAGKDDPVRYPAGRAQVVRGAPRSPRCLLLAGPGSEFEASVFVNCPFDDAYKPMFEAIVFAVFDCVYRPRCALEAYDAGEVRIEKIVALVRNCRLGVHDISRTELNAASLPRFNMPFELGLFLGAKRFGNAVQRRKTCLVLDREPYRYQAFLSDIAGQDIAAHGGEPTRAIGAVRDWLAAGQRRRPSPGGAEIVRRFAEFSAALPGTLADLRLGRDAMTFSDYANIASTWLAARVST